MSYKINFDNLTDTEFENFCFDLLKGLKCEDLNWRKGTGKSSSPADGGRDIECTYIKMDYLLGETNIEKWFVECKHYIKGVPADKLLGALTSAMSMDINRCVIIVSNFLSNPAKDMLNNFIEKNRPKFKISIWERPKLEVLTKNMDYLLRKYNIMYKDDILDYMNPYHIEYIKFPYLNKLSSFLEPFNKLDKNTKNEIVNLLSILYLGEYLETRPSVFSNYYDMYNELLKKFIKVSDITSEHVVVNSITSIILNFFYRLEILLL
ncbi:restriction endonuclease [Clostridioides difficile]|nr:restriction endonuclease [Clostridioides difficile]